MFREMRRAKQALTDEECIEILKNEPRGVMAVNGEDGYPYAFPMDFVYLDGKLYFHSAKEGAKLDLISRDERISFCVMDQGFRKEGDWALYVKSVILFGRIRVVAEEEKVDLIRKLGLKYYPTPEEAEKVVKKHAGNALVFELTIDHMTGKLVHEK